MSPVPIVARLAGKGNPSDKFNMVVLGEGFQAGELGVFDEYADLVAVRLLNVTPFPSVEDRINVWKVTTPSVDSGVSFAGKPKNTHYGVAGNWQNAGYPGYFGTPFQDRVIAASALAVPQGAPIVRIVIVNYDADGGRGSHDDLTIFIPLFKVDENGAPVKASQRKRDFVEILAHECGHAIANLAEEYISCNEHTVGELHPNQQTPEETAVSPIVKWKGLARASELNAAGQFKAVHQVGDRMKHSSDEPPAPIVASRFTGMLGLYWGCMDIDPNLKASGSTPAGECDELDRRGAPFHRPMARCRMRFQSHQFCRVCADTLKRIIVESTP
jgi:hypothetical protein